MKQKRIICFILTLILSLSFLPNTSSAKTTSKEKTQKKFESIMHDILVNELSNDTLLLHQNLEDPEKFGIKHYEPTLGSCSLESARQSLEDAKLICNTLKGLNYNDLTEKQKLTYDIVLENYTVDPDMKDLLIYQEILAPTTGVHLNFPIVFAEYKFRNKQDIDDYIKLMNDFPRYCKDIILYEQEKWKANAFMSETSKNKVITQCKDFMSKEENNILLTSFTKKINNMKGLTKKEIASYIEQNNAAFNNSILPGYQTLIDGLTRLKGSTYTVSPYSTDRGKKYYEYLVQMETSTEESVDDIIKLYDEYTKKYMKELQDLLTNNPILIAKISSFSYKLYNSTRTLAQIQKNMKKDFPKGADVTYKVKQLDKSLESMSVGGFYLIPPIDNYKENVIYVNKVNNADPISLLTTISHEGFPGHLYQMTYFNKNNSAPIRTFLRPLGFSEGWAVYSSNQAYVYAGIDEGVAEFLKLQNQLNWLLNGRIDLGVNYENWSLDELKEGLAVFGLQADTAMAESIRETCLSDPATYVPYTSGMLKMNILRDQAETKLGKNFSAKKFHKFLLDLGPCQFNILDQQFKKWLKDQK